MTYSVGSLREILREQGILQAELAEVAKLSQSTVSRILDGSTANPRQSTLRRLIDAADRIRVSRGEPQAADGQNPELDQHLQFIGRWIEAIAYNSGPEGMSFSDRYVDLSVAPTAKSRVGGCFSQRVSELRTAPGNIIILGTAGAGKTFALKKIASEAIAQYNLTSVSPPVVVQLRNLDQSDSLTDVLGAILGVLPELGGTLIGQPRPAYLRRSAVVRELDRIGALLLLDGLDELNPNIRHSVMRELEDFLYESGRFRLLMTCRIADYRFALPSVQMVEMLPLTQQQINDFISQWLDDDRARDLVHALSKSPVADTAVRPLTLAQLCATYDRAGQLPRRPQSVYRKVVSLLTDEWDEQRGIRRLSRYTRFGNRGKEEFLSALAFELCGLGARSVFSLHQLENAYRRINRVFELPDNEAVLVTQEIASHTGLIVEAGFECYQFAHRSIQEYLVAKHIVGLPIQPKRWITEMPNEWAVAVALSSAPELYLMEVLTSLVQMPVTERLLHPLEKFLGRLADERPECSSSPALGWTVIAFASHLAGMAPSSRPSELGRIRAALHNLLHLTPLKESLHSALADIAGCSKDHSSRRIRIPPALLSEAPLELRDFLVRQGKVGLYVDEDWLGLGAEGEMSPENC